jgi:hypothetical protein
MKLLGSREPNIFRGLVYSSAYPLYKLKPNRINDLDEEQKSTFSSIKFGLIQLFKKS